MNPSANHSLLRYRLAIVAAAVLWSLGGLFIKALSTNPEWRISAMGITFYRSLSAALCLTLLVRGRVFPSRRDTACSVLLYTGLLALYVSATQGTTAANAIFLQYTAPVYAMVLGAVFFKEPCLRSDVVAVAVAMLGMGVLFLGNFRGGEQGPLLMGAGSGLMFGIFLLWLRRLRYADPVATTWVNNLGVAFMSAAVLAWTAPGELALVPRAVGTERGLLPAAVILAVMGCLQIAAPYVLFSYALRRIPAVEASLISLLEPILNPVWVALVVGEKPTLPTVLGGALIVLALAGRYTIFRPTKPPA